MTAWTIPEEILPGALFVPDAFDHFEIETGALPNGGDALVVRGDLDRNYKALQKAPTLSPNLFKSRVAVGWAMSFWIYMPNLTITSVTSPYRSDQILFGSMSRGAINTAYSGGIHQQAPSDMQIPELEWCVCRYMNASGVSGCHLGFIRQSDYRNSIPGLSGGQSDIWSTALTPNTWNQVIINVPSPFRTAPTGYVNNGAVINGTHSSGSFTQQIADPTLNPYFCIGSYSDESGFDGADGLWKIGKLAFHNRVLTTTDRDNLYNAMTT